MDKRVEIHGTSRADMNGKRGVATDFHYYEDDPDLNKDRYTVQLDSGEVFKVKPASLRAEGAGGGAGGGGTAGGAGGGARGAARGRPRGRRARAPAVPGGEGLRQEPDAVFRLRAVCQRAAVQRPPGGGGSGGGERSGRGGGL